MPMIDPIDRDVIFGDGFTAGFGGASPASVPYLKDADAQRTEKWLSGWYVARILTVLERDPDLGWEAAEKQVQRDALDAANAR
jgi:ribosome modulation factor